MPRSSEILGLLIWCAALGAALWFTPAPHAADGGSSALPRREDVTYLLPGAGESVTAVLSWATKYDDDSAFAGIDSVTPSEWTGQVYGGLSWFWKEEGLPGEISFVGFAANQDTVVYDPPIRWLPLDPEAAGQWETTSTTNKGDTWTFRFRYDGETDIASGGGAGSRDYVCWTLLLEQVGPTAAVAEGSSRDGMGVPRPALESAKAFTDTLYYEVDALPRRRIASRNAFPQNELMYDSHLTRETPVSTGETGVGGLKARYRR